MSRIGRNDPCPCGSGKKYKKCCMMKDQAQKAAELSDAEVDTSSDPADDHNKRRQPEARAAEMENIFRRACNCLDRNELDGAARAFRSVLLMDPTHYKALTGLGRCLAEMGMSEEARKCFEKALEIKPDYAQARVNLELHGS